MTMETLIADRLEISDLFSRFGRLLDEHHWEGADTVFAPDITVTSPRAGQLTGIDQVVGYIRQSVVPGEHTQHITTDLQVDIDGDQASAAANSQVYFYRDGQPPHQISGLRLVAGVVRTPNGWRLNETRTILNWVRTA
ncbi:nuclear transport factor 2 family protein [Nocardia sp. NPDC056100]|uniref:nuclear transport factor 2 family protein n=1 Tax=Nocardia sp. NPDC056100 TaxID=3345712 RepID=UPI0035E0CFE0